MYTRGSTLIQLLHFLIENTALIGMTVTGMTRHILTHGTIAFISVFKTAATKG
ncbi:MAG: hypothetical protein JSY10_11965 [Paenibacillus sp.]|nr:hypothetical protein [Paenibacillus sp.]